MSRNSSQTEPAALQAAVNAGLASRALAVEAFDYVRRQTAEREEAA